MTPERKDSSPERGGPSMDAVRLAQMAMRDISADTPTYDSDRDSLLGAVQDEMRSQADQAEAEAEHYDEVRRELEEHDERYE